MELTHNQKRYINKNLNKISVSQMARNIQRSEKEIISYIKTQNGEEKIVTPINEVKKEEKFFSLKNFIKKNYWQFILLAVFVFTAYINSLGNGFVSDDVVGIQKNPELSTYYQRIFKEPFIFLQILLYYFIYKIGGVSPVLFRLFNVFFHLGTVFSIFILLAILGNTTLAFLTAAFFAIHPMTIEAVGWISGGQYVRYSFFFLLSFVTYILSKKNNKLFLVSLIFFILSLFSGDKAIVIPLLFLLYEFSFGGLKENWKRILIYFFIAGGLIIFYLFGISSRIAGLQVSSYTKPHLLNPLVQIPIAITTYLQLILWPDKLTLYHSDLDFSVFEYMMRAIISLGFFGLILVFWKKNRQIFFWLMFFLISLLPTLTPLGISWIVAERYVYLGLIGILFVICYALGGLIKNEKTKVMGYVLCVICILGLTIRTVVRNTDWKNEDSLWISMKDISSADPKTHNNLGDMYGRQGNMTKSIEEFKKAIAINPNYGDAYHNLGNAYLRIGKTGLALENYQKALKTNPNLWQSYLNIAVIEYNQKKYDLAQINLEKAILINTEDDTLYLNLGIVYLQTKNIEKAKQALTRAVEINNNAQAKQLLLEITKTFNQQTPIK